MPRARRVPPPARGRLLTAACAAAGLLLLAGCGAQTTAAPAAGASASTAVPTRDVVSGVHADARLHARLPAAARRSGTLAIGTTLTPGTAGLPHGGQVPDGHDVGLDVDLRNAVAKVLGVRWAVHHGTFATVIPGVQNGRYQVGQANFGVTASREKVVDFATYLNDGQSFLGAADAPVRSVRTLRDLCGLTVATTPGSTFQQILTDGAADCRKAGKKPYRVQYFADTAPIFLGLGNGKVDAFFGPTLSLRYDAKHVPRTRFLGELSSTPVGFVTARHSPLGGLLRDAVNKLIADGDYARIFAKWGVRSTEVRTSRLNPPSSL